VIDTDLTDDVELAFQLADAAAVVALPFFERGVTPETKSDGSPVSEADLAVDRVLLEMLAAARPDDAVLSEESGERPGRTGRRWILDPIDGTFNFVAARPAWGTHVALTIDGELAIGVITRPVTSVRYWATRGGGAHAITASGEAPTRLAVSDRCVLEECRASVWGRGSEYRELLAGACLLRDADLDDVLAVARGDHDAVVDSHGAIWDNAPAVLIVEEAGGRYRDHDGGRRLDLGRAWFTNGVIDDAIAAALGH
jgi:histidinol-phosphatase